MAAHARRQIRDAVEAAVTNLAQTGTRVFTGRTRQLPKDHADSLLIYARDENAEPDTQGAPRALFRTLDIDISGRVIRATPPDDALDQIAAEVEEAIGAASTLGGLVLDIVLLRTEIHVDASGEKHNGEIRMTFRVLYRTAENAPTVILD